MISSESVPLKPPPLSPPRNTGFKFRFLRKLARLTRKYQPRGIHRFLRAIYNPFQRQKDHFDIVVEYDSGLFLHVDTASLLEWYLFFYGKYEAGTVSLIKRLMRPGSVGVDVGAHIGSYALLMGLMAGETGKVLAVEPYPPSFNRLVENIHLNRLKNVVPVQCALSDEKGTTTLYSYGSADGDIITTFYKENLKFPRPDVPPEARILMETPVEVRTLDDVVRQKECSRLDVLKIDVEGNEYRVLAGGQETIREFRPHIIFEYNPRTWKNAGCDFHAVQDFFSTMNYSLYVIQEGYLTKIEYGLPAGANLLAVPKGVLTK